MSGFSAGWLRMREPFDAAARDAAAVELGLAGWLAGQKPRGTDVSVPPAGSTMAGDPGEGRSEPPAWRVIDLACGTGANLRALAPQLGGSQQWLVVDHDPDLLAAWPAALADACSRTGHRFEIATDEVADITARLATGLATDIPAGNASRSSGNRQLKLSGPGFSATIERRSLDLARHLETLPFEGTTLVTASALLDLVSAPWIHRLAAACRNAHAAALFTLSVDGRHVWNPADPHDARASALFEAHQARDKGFGPAEGARAATLAADAFCAAGHTVRLASSDWLLDGRADPSALALQHSMIDGIAAAAIEQEPAAEAAMRAWQARRHALAAHATLRVGHVDLIATPPPAV